MLEGRGCTEGRTELINDALSPKPTNNRPPFAFLFMDKRRRVKNDATSVFSTARIFGLHCSSQRVILVTVAPRSFPFVVGVRCLSNNVQVASLISALGMCFPTVL